MHSVSCLRSLWPPSITQHAFVLFQKYFITSEFRFWCLLRSDLLVFRVDVQLFHNQFGEFIIFLIGLQLVQFPPCLVSHFLWVAVPTQIKFQSLCRAL